MTRQAAAEFPPTGPARGGSQQQGNQLHGCQLITRSHPVVVELADFVAERALSGLELDLAARTTVIRMKAVTKRTQLLVLRLRQQWLQKAVEVIGLLVLLPAPVL